MQTDFTLHSSDGFSIQVDPRDATCLHLGDGSETVFMINLPMNSIKVLLNYCFETRLGVPVDRIWDNLQPWSLRLVLDYVMENLANSTIVRSIGQYVANLPQDQDFEFDSEDTEPNVIYTEYDPVNLRKMENLNGNFLAARSFYHAINDFAIKDVGRYDYTKILASIKRRFQYWRERVINFENHLIDTYIDYFQYVLPCEFEPGEALGVILRSGPEEYMKIAQAVSLCRNPDKFPILLDYYHRYPEIFKGVKKWYARHKLPLPDIVRQLDLILPDSGEDSDEEGMLFRYEL